MHARQKIALDDPIGRADEYDRIPRHRSVEQVERRLLLSTILTVNR